MQVLVRGGHRLLPIATPDPKIIQAKKGHVVPPLRGWCQLDGWSCGLTAAFSGSIFGRSDTGC